MRFEASSWRQSTLGGINEPWCALPPMPKALVGHLQTVAGGCFRVLKRIFKVVFVSAEQSTLRTTC